MNRLISKALSNLRLNFLNIYCGNQKMLSEFKMAMICCQKRPTHSHTCYK